MSSVFGLKLRDCLLIAGLVLLGILLKPATASAAFPTGSPTNSFPNNSSWEPPPPPAPRDYAKANQVVAQGGMDASESDTLLFFPYYGDPNDSDQTTRLFIEGACDNDPNDVGDPDAADTQFYLQNVGNFNVISNNVDIFVNDPGYIGFICRPGAPTDLVIDIQMLPSENTIRTYNIGGNATRYRVMLMYAVISNDTGGLYENQFKVRVSSPDILITYNTISITGQTYRTGIYNRTADALNCAKSSGDPACYWSTSIGYAPPCDWQNGNTEKIIFYDSDADAGNFQAAPNNIRWSIYKFPRDGSGGGTIVASGNLTSGENQEEEVRIVYETDYSYEIRLDHILVRNSIQVLLPWEQINALESCFAIPKGVIDNVVCSKIYGWAFDPDTPSQSIQVHIYLDGPAGGGSPYPPSGFTADKRSDGGTDPSPPTAPPGDVNGAYGITGRHRFDVPFTSLNQQQRDALATGGTHTFYVYAIDSGGRPTNPEIGRRTFDMSTCVPPANFRCSTISTNPNPVEAGAPFRLRINVSTDGGTTASYPYTATLNVPGPPTNPGSMSAHSPVSGTLPKDDNRDIDFEPLTVDREGYYQGNVTIVISGGPTLICPFNNNAPPCATSGCSFLAVTKPYFQAKDGDVATGINGSCTGWTGGAGTGTLTAWNQALNLPPNNDANKGAGTNLAAFALNHISGFASAQNRASPSPPKGLSFSNTSGNPTFGGNFGGGITCPNNYYGDPTTLLPAPSAISGSTSVPDTNQAYYAATDLTITGVASPIGPGNKPVIYVNGDVYISGDITLSSGATIDQLSNFYLVVRGNIYIAPGVGRLDGVYIAQPGGGAAGGGKIYTCAFPGGPNNWRAPDEGELNGACKTRQLFVNGAFIAVELKLYRSFGSMSTAGPAELFTYTPGTWLAAPCSISGNCSDGSTDGYDAITSLPPVL